MIPTRRSCRFLRTMLRYTTFRRELPRSHAVSAWPLCIRRMWSEYGWPAAKPSANDGASIAQNIVSFALAARFDGSRYGASLHTQATDIRRGPLASARTALIERRQRVGSENAMRRWTCLEKK